MALYTLSLLPDEYAVCQLPATAHLPAWATGSSFCSITRTADELSIICPQANLPPDLPDDLDNPDHLIVARAWRILRVNGPFDFSVTGVMAALSVPLAAAGVVLLPVATYATDYLLVQTAQLAMACTALRAAGHTVVDDSASDSIQADAQDRV